MDEFRPENFRDTVRERVLEEIQRKVDGQEISAAPAEAPQTKVIDLMEALKASLAKRGASTEEKQPARQAAMAKHGGRRSRAREGRGRRRPRCDERVILAPDAALDMKSYSTRDVAHLLGLSEAQVRSQARGYLAPDRGPRNSYRFSFQDLVLLRTAKALGEARVAPRRIRRALRALARDLPAGRPLSGVCISSEGDRVVVRDGSRAWNPESGQLLLDFHVGELAERSRAGGAASGPARAPVRRAAHRGAMVRPRRGPRDRGARTTRVTPTPARSRSIRGTRAARINLGRMHQEAGRAAEAATEYRAALVSQPTHPTAAFNLGTALEDLGRHSRGDRRLPQGARGGRGVRRRALQPVPAVRAGAASAPRHSGISERTSS